MYHNSEENMYIIQVYTIVTLTMLLFIKYQLFVP